MFFTRLVTPTLLISFSVLICNRNCRRRNPTRNIMDRNRQNDDDGRRKRRKR